MKQLIQQKLPFNKIGSKERDRILSRLGLIKTDNQNVYEHPDFNYQFDLSKVSLEKILEYVAIKFVNIGYTNCQENFRQALGLE